MTKRAQWSRWDHFGGWFLVACFIWFVVWTVTDVTRNLNISAIEIADVYEGDPITVNVSRSLHGTWNGAYRVTIRSAPGGSMVCTTGDVYLRYSEFNEDGTPRELPIPVPLAWWADGGTCSDDLALNILPVGQYAVETCHAKRFLVFFHKWNCWQGGPIFRVMERN